MNDARMKAYMMNAVKSKKDGIGRGEAIEDKVSKSVFWQIAGDGASFSMGKDTVRQAGKNAARKAGKDEAREDRKGEAGQAGKGVPSQMWKLQQKMGALTGKGVVQGEGVTSADELLRRTEALKNQGLLKVGEDRPKGEEDSVWRRVAKFLLVIGVDEAAKVMRHLTDDQTARIVPEIASIRSVSEEEAKQVLKEFSALMRNARENGGVDTAREILTKAYGEDKANEMLDAAVPFSGGKPFEYLNDAPDAHVKTLLEDEGVAVQAIVLSRIDAKKAAAVISLMDIDERRQVVSRLAHIEQVLPDTLRRIDASLHKKLLSLSAEMAEAVDGRATLTEILKRMTPEAEDDLLDTIGGDDPDLADDLRSRLFTLGDVVDADDRFLQRQLHEMDDVSIAYLIADKDEAFRAKIFSCLSRGRGNTVRDEEQIMKPMRKRDCDEVTSRFVTELRRAYEKGELKILNREDEEYVE